MAPPSRHPSHPARPEGADPGAPSPSGGAHIDRARVEHVASLARLDLAPDEAQAMARDLERLLAYVDALDELDTADVEPTAHVVPLRTPVRADEPGETLARDEALANAPQRDAGAFVVPHALAEDEEG